MKTRSLIILSILFAGLFLFYFKSFNSFFLQDDFFNITISQKHNLLDAFNIFKKPIMNFYFYRPLSIQLYWTVGRAFFDLNPLGYHVINFIFFLTSIYLVYALSKTLKFDEKTALLASFFYGFAASHYYRLFFISLFQEIAFATFALATIILFLRKSWWTPVFLALSLATKETAVMIAPYLLFISLFLKIAKKIHLKILLSTFAILGLYLFARIFYFGFARGATYAFDFAPFKVANNFFWYTLWAIGLPEAFVNIEIFKFPTIINPALFTAFKGWANYVLAFFALFVLLLFSQAKVFVKNFNRIVLIAIACFVFFLLPVAFFPFHKFPYSLAVPLAGSSIFLATCTAKLSKKKIFLICAVYLLLSTTAYFFNLSGHWVSRKANTAQAVFKYFKTAYPRNPDKPIYFRNSGNPVCRLTKMGEPRYSLEVSYGIGGVEGLRYLYNDDHLPIYYEDIDADKHFSFDAIVIDSSKYYDLDHFKFIY